MGYPNFDSIDFNFRRSFITLMDFPVLMLFLLVGVIVFNLLRRKNKWVFGAKPSVFFGAFFLHAIGSIFITLIYSYYYEGGDTSAYFNDARLLQKIFWNDPKTAIDIFFSSSKSLLNDHPYIYKSFRFVAATDTFAVVRICFLIQFFSLNLILPTALIVGYISFYFTWRFYVTICTIYPKLSRQLAIPIFFLPSVHVWGSGIFKDTFSITLIYVILITLYSFKYNVKFWNFLVLLFSMYLLFVIKIYILMTLTLGLSCFFVFRNMKLIKNMALRMLIFPLLVSIGGFGFFYSFKLLGDNSKKGIYSIEQIVGRAEIVSNYLAYVSDKSDGSTYDLGIREFSIPNLILNIPASINVTLFRPYIWEVKNPLMLAAAAESGLIFILTLYIIFRVGIYSFFKRIMDSPFVISILVYCFSFAFAIGITSNNFGTLTRYKIPIIPFYVIALMLILAPSFKKKHESLK